MLKPLYKTIQLNLKTTLNRNCKYCTGCPACDIDNQYCKHLDLSIEVQQRQSKGGASKHGIRSEFCPFNSYRCTICDHILTPILSDVGGYVLTHICQAEDTTSNSKIIIYGDTEDDCINKYIAYRTTEYPLLNYKRN